MPQRIPLEKDSIVESKCGKKYKIIRLLSESGGTALTYYARREMDDRLVVLKELYPVGYGEDFRSQRPDSDYTKLFSMEADSNRKLEEQFAQRVLPESGARLTPDYAFACSDVFEAINGMQYIEISTGSGEVLTTWKFSSAAQRVNVALKICRAVAELHKLGYLHLDLKPDNVFVIDVDNIRLLDFGSMLEIGQQCKGVTTYSDGFSAPEIRPGYMYTNTPTPSADCFSITAILYWLLFEKPIPEEKLRYISELTINPPQLMGYSLNAMEKSLEILRKGMAFDPNTRYKTADELDCALNELQNLMRIDDEQTCPKDANAFVRRLSDVFDFERNNLPELGKNYAQRHINEFLPQITGHDIPASLINAVDTMYRNKTDYFRTLYCLRFLHLHAPFDCWDKGQRIELLKQIRYCCSNVHLTGILKEYPLGKDIKSINDTLEEQFAFDKIVVNIEDYLCSQYETTDVMQALCAETEMDKETAQYAGELAEALCLQRAEGWDEKALKIMEITLERTTNQDASFRDRSVDNLLWFAVETRSEDLFLQTLSKLSQSHRLYKKPEDAKEDWIRNTLKGFSESLAIEDRYPLYLFLKSLNVLFSNREWDERDKKAFVRLVSLARKNGLFNGHPCRLIQKHMLILTKSINLGVRDRAILNEMLDNLKGEMRNADKDIDIISLITQATLLEVTKDREWVDHLVMDIKKGVAEETLDADYFKDILSQDNPTPESLLSKFRFRHS